MVFIASPSWVSIEGRRPGAVHVPDLRATGNVDPDAAISRAGPLMGGGASRVRQNRNYLAPWFTWRFG